MRLAKLIALLLACSLSQFAAADDALFPRPPALEPDVQFWIKVYTEVNTNAERDTTTNEAWTLAEAATRIRTRSIPEELAAALDDWSSIRGRRDEPGGKRLRAVARAATSSWSSPSSPTPSTSAKKTTSPSIAM